MIAAGEMMESGNAVKIKILRDFTVGTTRFKGSDLADGLEKDLARPHLDFPWTPTIKITSDISIPWAGTSASAKGGGEVKQQTEVEEPV